MFLVSNKNNSLDTCYLYDISNNNIHIHDKTLICNSNVKQQIDKRSEKSKY